MFVIVVVDNVCFSFRASQIFVDNKRSRVDLMSYQQTIPLSKSCTRDARRLLGLCKLVIVALDVLLLARSDRLSKTSTDSQLRQPRSQFRKKQYEAHLWLSFPSRNQDFVAQRIIQYTI